MSDKEVSSGKGQAGDGGTTRKGTFYRKGGSKDDKFEGREPDLKGYVYDDSTTFRQEQQWQKTTEEIARYINANYSKCGWEVAQAIRKLEVPKIDEIAEPGENPSVAAMKKYEIELTEKLKREGQIGSYLKKAYALVWGQCSESIRDRVKADPDYETFFGKGDTIGLLKAIRGCILDFQSHKYLTETHYDVLKKFYACRQGKEETVQTYKTRFDAIVEQVEHVGAIIGENPREVDMQFKQTVVDTTKTKGEQLDIMMANVEGVERAKGIVKEKFLAVAFLKGSDRQRFRLLIEDLENDYLRGSKDSWPTALHDAYSLMLNWKKNHVDEGKSINRGNDGVAFVQEGKTFAQAAKEGGGSHGQKKDKSHIQCFACKQYGHYAGNPECPLTQLAKSNQHAMMNNGVAFQGNEEDKGDSGMVFVTTHEVACNMSDGQINHNWILLDNQSTVDVFANRDLLSNVREAPNGASMTIHSTGGKSITNTIGELKGYGTVWYHS
ncbi:MAG: hypothetical protein AAFO96_27965, partial [Bacteroidota bacterium]